MSGERSWIQTGPPITQTVIETQKIALETELASDPWSEGALGEGAKVDMRCWPRAAVLREAAARPAPCVMVLRKVAANMKDRLDTREDATRHGFRRRRRGLRTGNDESELRCFALLCCVVRVCHLAHGHRHSLCRDPHQPQ